jgi:hypothetical protein
VPLAEFDVERNADVARVLDVLADRRLLTVSEGAVEVAHEALLREWPRFQEWLEEDREGRRLHAHLTATAHEWGERGQDGRAVPRGATLGRARLDDAAHARAQRTGARVRERQPCRERA